MYKRQGKDIIPTMLNDNRTLYAYKFEGYWKDVGTIDSLWEANMDLLSSKNELDLGDPSWKIYTEDVTALPQYISAEADVKDAYITQGCVVQGLSLIHIWHFFPSSFSTAQIAVQTVSLKVLPPSKSSWEIAHLTLTRSPTRLLLSLIHI